MTTIAMTHKPAVAVTASPSPTPNKNVGWITRCVVKIKAKRRVNKIMRSLHEAKQIHAGKRKAQTFDEFLEGF